MTIKRKTQLNLSGSHRNVDADIAWVGSNLYVTGSSQFTGSAYFQQITGSISGTLGGLPFIVAGPNMAGVNYNAGTGQWELSGATGTSVAGSNTYIQFNADGTHGASSLLTFNTASNAGYLAGTLVAPTASFQYLSGGLANAPVFSDLGYTAPILGIDSNVLVTQSLMVFDGTSPDLPIAGLLLTNGAGVAMFSGSAGSQPAFGLLASTKPDQVTLSIEGEVTIKSGSLYVNSGSSNDQSFTIEPSTTATKVNVIFDRTGSVGGVIFGGINVRPLYSSMTTSGSAGTIMSGNLIAFNGNSGPNSVGKVDFNVVAVQKDTDNYGSWTFSTTVARDTAGATSVIAYSELDAATSGSAAAAWDVNINSDAVIYCTGSAGAEIQWYAHVTKKMFLSGSGLITY